MTFWSGANLDRRRRKAVLPEHEKDDRVSQNDKDVSRNRNGGRGRRPAKAMVEPGDDKDCAEPDRDKPHDDLLARFFSAVGPPRMRRASNSGVVFDEVERDGEPEGAEQSEEGPRPPIAKRSGSEKQHCSHDDEREEKFAQRSDVGACHVLILARGHADATRAVVLRPPRAQVLTNFCLAIRKLAVHRLDQSLDN